MHSLAKVFIFQKFLVGRNEKVICSCQPVQDLNDKLINRVLREQVKGAIFSKKRRRLVIKLKLRS